ncbi:MAG: TylF/MycF/NovP-related O-methyltransferase, partial [Caulobacteraceae bacterium]
MPLLSTLGRRWTPLRRAAAALTPPILWRWMNQTLVVGAIADRECYDPVFKPWLRRDFADLYHTIAGHTEVSVERCWTLARLLSQSLNLPGDVMEAGVYRGGTARLLKGLMGKGRRLWLFDSFAGMRAVSPELDRVKAGS